MEKSIDLMGLLTQEGCTILSHRIMDDLKKAGCEHAAPKWVDVKERLPEDGQQVLAWEKGGRCVTAIWKEHNPVGSFLAYSYFTEELEEAEEITHWMPLPSPPSTPTV
jgi:hypothetical protein